MTRSIRRLSCSQRPSPGKPCHWFCRIAKVSIQSRFLAKLCACRQEGPRNNRKAQTGVACTKLSYGPVMGFTSNRGLADDSTAWIHAVHEFDKQEVESACLAKS